MTIYTLGYSGWRIDDIAAKLEELNAVLFDVRMVARSRNAVFNGASLQRRLGDRYVYLREFGNRNYKLGLDQAEIVDFPTGEQRLRDLVAGGKGIILMCGCPDVSQCHRKLLADWLGRLWHAEIMHLTRPDNGSGVGQRLLF